MTTYALVLDTQISPDLDILQSIVTGDLLSVLGRALELRQKWAAAGLEVEHARRVFHDADRAQAAQRLVNTYVEKHGDPRHWNIVRVAPGWKAAPCDVKDRVSAEGWADSRNFGNTLLRDWFLRLPLPREEQTP